MAELLRAGRFEELDLEHVAEEIEDLGKRDRRSLESQLDRLVLHQIKRKVQPDKQTSSWLHSINDSQKKILGGVRDSPSLKPYLAKLLDDVYDRALVDAERESRLSTAHLPSHCPFTLDQLLENFDLDW